MIFYRQKGQTVMETAILFLAIVVAFLAMQAYLRRGIAGRMRDNIDAIGQQYDPGDTVSDFSINHISNMTTTTVASRELYTNPVSGQIENRLMTTIEMQTHYDNSRRAGREDVGGFVETVKEDE